MRVKKNEIIVENIGDLYYLIQNKISKQKRFWISTEKIVSAFKNYWEKDELDLYYNNNDYPFSLYDELEKIKNLGSFISIDLLFSKSYFYCENLTENSAHDLLSTPFFTIFPNDNLFVPEIIIEKKESMVEIKKESNNLIEGKYKLMI